MDHLRLQEAIGGWMLGQRDRLDLSEATIETMLSSARPGAVEARLRTGPITWLSDYAHHGGRTKARP